MNTSRHLTARPLNVLKRLGRPAPLSNINLLRVRSLHTHLTSPATSSAHGLAVRHTRPCAWSPNLPSPLATRSIFIQTEITPNTDVGILQFHTHSMANYFRHSNSFPITTYCQRLSLLHSSSISLLDQPWLPHILRPWPRDSSTLMELHLCSMDLILSQSQRLRM